jgi:phage terminase small subunit
VNNKQTVFVAEYLKDFNASRAAKAAGYSAKTAYSIGQENLKKPEIAEAIKAGIAERSMGKDEILLRLADMARGDIADLMDITSVGYTFKLMGDDGNVNPRTKLIKKIKQKVTTISARKEDGEDREIIETEIELYDAKSALDTLAKLSGMVVDKIAPTDPTGEKEYDPTGLLNRLLPELAAGSETGTTEPT